MSEQLQNAVAVIGMAGRFPGAENIEQFWSNLCEGRESVQAIPEQELEDGFTAAERSQGKYVAARGLLNNVDQFDAEFFHFLPREAELADPQQRVLLECAWNAFEDAGYDPARVHGNVGVFAGSSINTYLLLQLASDEKFRREFTRSYQVGSFPALVGNGHDFLATRISYKLNLRGPAMTVQSACSTSLLAIAQAWQSLMNFQCDLALAGAASISFPQRRGYFYQEGGMVSPDGHCRPFDKDAQGTVFGAGAGMVLLKRVEDAIADGDHIYALLLGAGVNNDGSEKIGYAAPSSKGQAEAVTLAHAIAGVDAGSIDYVECHGTGTPLGDPIEVNALAEAFVQGQPRANRCLLSSVKGNIGHVDVAAGIAGFIKATLSLERETIPGTLYYRAPNPKLELEQKPFFITPEATAWKRNAGSAEKARRAGVSAFGVGGTNVHVVLQEAPSRLIASSPRSRQLLCLSARSAAALDAQCAQLAGYLASNAETNSLADIAFTLATGRRPFSHRLAIAAETPEQAIAQLRAPEKIRTRGTAGQESPRIAMLFPGQGSQYPGMGEDLYRTEPVYRQAVDECCKHLQRLAGLDLLPVLYPNLESADTTAREQAAATLEQTRFAQPALFVTSYALALLWKHWGVGPACMAGHSIGEIAAATLAGVFSLEDALLLVARRGEWMQQMSPGAMLAVKMEPEKLQKLLPRGTSIAAINAPSLAVASGPLEEIEQLEAKLQQDQIITRRLRTSHAFHSAMMEPVVAQLRELLATMDLHAPQAQIISTVTGAALTPEQAVSPEYWAQHCRVPVNFSAAAETLSHENFDLYLEAGAGETLTTLLRQHLPRDAKSNAIPSLPPSPKTAWESLANAVGSLWSRGGSINWQAYYGGEQRHRVSLPTYPFERKRYWVEAAHNSTQEIVETSLHETESNSLNSLHALENTMTPDMDSQRTARLRQEVAAILEDLSGLELAAGQYDASFLELGFDSLLLTQVAQKLQTTYGVKITFRELLDQLSSIGLVAEALDEKLPKETSSVPQRKLEAAPVAATTVATAPAAAMVMPAISAGNATAALMQQQLQAMTQLIQSQLQILGVAGASASTVAAIPAPVAPAAAKQPEVKTEAAATASTDQNALHQRPVQHSHITLTAEQQQFLNRLMERYCNKTAQSKAFTQKHRRTLADPRVVSGFRPEWKEMVYSIVSSRSKGSKLWDIDGNEYIDLLNGFGPTMFGHSPDFVNRAVQAQMDEGFAIGPQTPLAGRAADLLVEMTGTDRVTFCNTGSEAVMAAMRLARTVTGRDRVVFFAGDYHGQFDEVLAKQLRRKGEFTVQPAAPGIPRPNLGSITVLDYGTEESLQYIQQHANELAAVLIEPVQSRHPNFQPREFLTRVREITRQSGTAFIFDEVVTGFRIHPRGAQGFYGIDADMMTYGKVIGGGMPIGILAGKSAFMDALDGGYWEFGDRSVPEVGVTFFAGTFVRHPLTMAALCATLEHIRNAGEALYNDLNQRADRFTGQLQQLFAATGCGVTVEHCGSVMFLKVPADARFGGLLYYLLREKGVFILEGFPSYLTTEHSDADLARVVQAFQESIAELQAHDLLPHASEANAPQLSVPAISENETVQVTEVPLTEPQLEILLAAQISDEANRAFNESFRVEFQGTLKLEALESAWQALLRRHDALRMSLNTAGDGMRMDSERPHPIEKVNLTAQSVEKQKELLETLIAAEGTRAFDLAQGPFVRAQLIELAADRNVLIVTAHHLICDGWSVNVLVDELGQLYSASLAGKNAELAPRIPFSEYALTAQSSAAKDRRRVDLEYWKQRLTPQPELLTLPADRGRSAVRSFAGSTYVTEFSRDFSTALRKAGAGAGCTLFTTLLAGWQILLWRLSGNGDPVTMIPAAAQSQIEDKVLVGHCVHLLPIRAALGPEMTATSYLRALKPVVLDAYEHQNATYGSMVREIHPAREAGRLPISEVQFNLEQVGRSAPFAGLQTEVRANGKHAVNFDLFLNIVDTGKGLRLECDYSTALYDASTIARWLESYRTLLEGIIADASQPVAALPVIDAVQRQQLELANATATGPLPAENIPALLASAFSAMPSQPAADFYGMTLGRHDLAEQSDRLAAWLTRHNAGPGSLVGIYMDRSLEMLVAMLAVLKAGAAYVPLDPMFPAARIQQILEETNVPVMLTLSANLETLPRSTATVLALDTAAQEIASEPKVALPAPSAEDRAYVIFTSGSTGRPKGVEVTHGSLVNLLVDLGSRLDMQPSDRWLAVTTFSFDIAVLELLLPLVTGGTVALAHRDDVMDGARLMELLDATAATVMQATPVTWRMLLEQGFQCRPGFKMLCGGEAWTTAMADQLLGSVGKPNGRLWNMYGPTETTVWSSVTEVRQGASRMTIGPPMANTRFYVLDSRLQPVAPGTTGELLIAGGGVARGYFQRPELTAEKFLADPFVAGERMYRTGDEVRQLADGRIEFLGRLDNQIKLRGFRIELGEIETALRALPGVRDAVAILRPDAKGEPALVAYYTGAEEQSPVELRQALREQLPAYMIPAVLTPLPALPLTPNGKIDRRALPDVQVAQSENEAEFIAPATATEESLAQIFCDVLGCERISTHASLLDLGADSLRMFQIASRARRRGYAVTARQLIQLHTVHAVAAEVDAERMPMAASASAAPLRKVARDQYRVQG
jgi:amino acid adenylation domain-containing protein